MLIVVIGPSGSDGEVVGGDVAADGSVSGRIAGVRRRQRHNQDMAGDLGDHQPVAGGLAG